MLKQSVRAVGVENDAIHGRVGVENAPPKAGSGGTTKDPKIIAAVPVSASVLSRGTIRNMITPEV